MSDPFYTPAGAVAPSPAKPTLVAFLLDETLSMEACRDATISGFNEYTGTLAKEPAGFRVSLTTFNTSKFQRVFSDKPIAEVPKLTRETYVPSHSTPLYDAIARLIVETDAAIAAAPADVLFVIQTDGQENSSKEYRTAASIREMIEARKAKGWKFVFLGAEIDAEAAAADIGIAQMDSMSYDKEATGATFAAAGVGTMRYAARKAAVGADEAAKEGFWRK